MNIKTKLGFTLIEILVVVLIIGILGAIALPQYQRAVLKSRFAALMPIAKSMADSNEAYYLEHGNYADDPQDLLIQGQRSYPSGTELEFGTTTDYSYVLATNQNDTPNNVYVTYQKHSKNFPGNIHCEAADNDELATWLCRDALHGTPINTGEIKSLSGEGYTAYLLSGSTTGSTFDKSCSGSAPTETQDCESGCGQVSRTGTCNPQTGEWEFEEFDTSSCPTPLTTNLEEDCGENYTGKQTRTGDVCQDGVYTYSDWNRESCTIIRTAADDIRDTCAQTSGCSSVTDPDTGKVTTTQCDTKNKQNIVITYDTDGTETKYRREQCDTGTFSNCKCGGSSYLIYGFNRSNVVMETNYCSKATQQGCSVGEQSEWLNAARTQQNRFYWRCASGTIENNCVYEGKEYETPTVTKSIYCDGVGSTVSADGTCNGSTWTIKTVQNGKTTYVSCRHNLANSGVDWDNYTCK